MLVLIKIEMPVSLEINELSDLTKLRSFMEDNNLKLNKSAIARELNVDRRTVGKYLDGFQKKEHRDKPSKVDEYRDIIDELLSSNTQIFHYRSVLYRYLIDNHNMDIPAQTFYHYIKSNPELDAYFRKSSPSGSNQCPVVRYETKYGEQAQLDWKESIPFILSDTGEVVMINVLVLILGHSRFRIYKPAVRMTQDVLIHLLTEMFEALGGVPEVLLTDNMKTIMDELKSASSQLTKRLSQQEESIKSILSSLGEIKNLLSQEEKIRKLKDKEETTTEEDLKKVIKKEINGNNDRLKYV